MTTWGTASGGRYIRTTGSVRQALNPINPWITTHGILRTRDRAVDRHQKSTKAKSEGKAPCLGIFFFTQHHVIIQYLYRLYYYIFSMLSSSKAHRICSVKGGLSWNFWGRSDLYLSYIMFTCSALFGKGLASSGGWNQAYCSAESARIGVLFLPYGLDVCFLLYLLSLKIPRGLGGKIYVFVWGGRWLVHFIGRRHHLSMDVDLYTFVDTCCLHYHQFWRIGLYIYIYSRDMKPSSKLEARKIHY